MYALKKRRKTLAAHLCCPAKQPWQALTDMNFKKGDVIIRQGWGSQSPTNRLKLHQTTSMFHRRFVSWKFHGGWDVSFPFVRLYSRTWKWYPRSLCTRGWCLQSNRFFYHLLLRQKCHMSPTDYSQHYRRRMWSPLKMKFAGETGDSFYILFDGEVRLCCQSDEVCIEYHHVSLNVTQETSPQKKSEDRPNHRLQFSWRRTMEKMSFQDDLWLSCYHQIQP